MLLRHFQDNVARWVVRCFGAEIASDKVERNFRFFEEAIELIQACGMSKADCRALLDYTFDRPKGEPSQEVGGVMVTLAALCWANRLDLEGCATDELMRISIPQTMTKIREKQAAKTHRTDHGPLPGIVEDY